MGLFVLSAMKWIIAIFLTCLNVIAMGQQLAVGDQVPGFELQNQADESFVFTDELINGPMVIYFYPKDDTPGCTREACSFRDSYEEFSDLGVQVVGISSDSPSDHRAFIEKYNLPFTLLSDPDNTVRKAFGVKGDLFGLIPGRVTFLVDSDGVVQHVFDSQTRSQAHMSESLEAARRMLQNSND